MENSRKRSKTCDGKCRILGVDIASGTREELFALSRDLLGRGGSIATVNPEMLVTASFDEELRRALSTSLCIPDGIGVVREMRRRGSLSDRFPGIELAEALLEVSAVRLAIIGGEAGVSTEALENLTARHRNVIPLLALSGYGDGLASAEKRLLECKPDLVFVCLGSPKQEIFIANIKNKLDKTLFIGLGGSADVWSGRVRRAPRIISSVGLEWAYRAVINPERIKRLPKLLQFVRMCSSSRRKSGKIGKKRPQTY